MKKDSQIMPAIILCLICLITTGLLSLTFSVTLSAREKQEELAASKNRQQLYPAAASFAAMALPSDPVATKGLLEAYMAKDDGGQDSGYLFVTEYRGYGGNVPVMLAVSLQGKITGIKILANDETPGLGKKVENNSFSGQFLSQGINKVFSVKPNDSGKYIIDAVSGATISSRAVTEAVNIAASYCRQFVKEVK